ncbi:MAG: hypothetical protein ACREEB_05770, partial [Caulobacteraceae bacterium]
MTLLAPKTLTDIEKLNSDFATSIGSFASLGSAMANYADGKDPKLGDLGLAWAAVLTRVFSIGGDLARIYGDTSSDPLLRNFKKYAPFIGSVSTIINAVVHAEKDWPSFLSDIKRGQYFDLDVDVAAANDLLGLISGIGGLVVQFAALPEEGPVLAFVATGDFIFNNLAGIRDVVKSLGVVSLFDPAGYSSTGSYTVLVGGNPSSVVVGGPKSFYIPPLPTQFAAWDPSRGAGFQGISQADSTDQISGEATFVGQSGADTFVMNGQIIAEGAAGGTGDTYIIPTGPTTHYTAAGNGLYGAGTIEDQSSGNKIMLAYGSSTQQLTTLTIFQFEQPGDFPTTVPVAWGVTNTGQNFILLQDTPGTADGFNTSQNPHNGEGTDFELYILAGGPTTSQQISYTFGLYGYFDKAVLNQDYEIAAHITIAAGRWSDYGISIVDDTAEAGQNPSYQTWFSNGFHVINYQTSGSLVHDVPADFLTGAGPGPTSGAAAAAGAGSTSEARTASDAPVTEEGSLTVSGGTYTIPAGEAYTSVTVSSGATLSGPGGIYGGGVSTSIDGNIDGVTIGEDAADLVILLNGTASALVLEDGLLHIEPTGTATSTFLEGGSATVFGVTSDSRVAFGGEESVGELGTSSGGVSISAVVSAGGVE